MKSGAALTAGAIEGFFGNPWSWPARLGNISFLHEWGYQFYIYAPKADPFLRRRWREPIPDETVERLSGLNARCRQVGVALETGLAPFEIYMNYDSVAKNDLRSKVRQLNILGAEMLCVLFDDMRGDIDELAELQARVVSDVCSWSSAKRLIICPTYYSDDSRLSGQFGSAPKSYLQDLGRLVDPQVDFFWTGERVISDGYSRRHLADVATRIGRKPFIWDNHTSNDSRRRVNYLFLDPSAGDWEICVDRAAGLAINPMNQPYLSRIALAGYRNLLSGATEHPLPQICQRLCGSPLAEFLIEDAPFLQTQGLAGLESEVREQLLKRYQSDAADPYAREICSWLCGEYAFDPQCLTT